MNQYLEKIRLLINNGQELSKQGKIFEAIDIFKEVIRLIESEESPDENLHSWAYIRIGALYGRSGNKKEALKCAEKAVDIAGIPEDPSQLIVLMQILSKGVGMQEDEAIQWINDRGSVSDSAIDETEEYAKEELGWNTHKENTSLAIKKGSSSKLPELELNISWENPQASYHGPRVVYNIVRRDYDNNEFGLVITGSNVKSSLQYIGKNLPDLKIYPGTLIALYYGGLSYLKIGNNEMGLRCLQILFSIRRVVSQIEYMPYNELIIAGSKKFTELTKEKSYSELLTNDIQEVKDTFTRSIKSGGCFIATAVYGSELADEVIYLSRFRDNFLSKYKLGRIFINIYQYISPPIAEWLERHRIMKFIIRNILIRPLSKIARLLNK